MLERVRTKIHEHCELKFSYVRELYKQTRTSLRCLKMFTGIKYFVRPYVHLTKPPAVSNHSAHYKSGCVVNIVMISHY